MVALFLELEAAAINLVAGEKPADVTPKLLQGILVSIENLESNHCSL